MGRFAFLQWGLGLALACGSGLGGAIPARASGAADIPGTTPFDDPKKTECGQSCLYERANDTIELEAGYLISKVNLLKSRAIEQGDEIGVDPHDKNKKIYKQLLRTDANGSTAESRQILESNLGSFCAQSTDWQPGNDTSVLKCWKRYVENVQLSLRKMRGAQVQNLEQIGVLAGSGRRVPTLPRGGAVKGAQAPYIPTLAELDPYYKRITENPAPNNQLVNVDYEDWLRSRQQKPALEDYVKVTEIPRNPDDPNSSKMVVIERDSKGNPVYDQVAYRAAMKKYSEREGKVNLGPASELGELTSKTGASVAKQQLTKDLTEGRRVGLAQMEKQGKTGKLGPGVIPLESLQAFYGARLLMINAANEALQKAGTSGVPKAGLSGDAKRQPAKAPDGSERFVAPPSVTDQHIGVEVSPDQFDINEQRMESILND